MTTTSGAYIKLPFAAGSDRLAADSPLSSADLAILSSNATLLCREGSLRTLWESAGDEVWTDCTSSDDPLTFPWDASGVFVRFAGKHRVRQYGETASWPTLHLRCRGRASSPYTLGVVLVVAPSAAYPNVAAPRYAVARTIATTLDDFAATLPLDLSALGAYDLATDDEGGRVSEFTAWVGAYSTSNSSGAKALLSTAVLYMGEP